MISTTYVVRTITAEDRERHELALARAEARGDPDELAAEKKVVDDWIAEQVRARSDFSALSA